MAINQYTYTCQHHNMSPGGAEPQDISNQVKSYSSPDVTIFSKYNVMCWPPF